jgi:hypothetical protein
VVAIVTEGRATLTEIEEKFTFNDDLAKAVNDGIARAQNLTLPKPPDCLIIHIHVARDLAQALPGIPAPLCFRLLMQS